jgi:endonuclease/exonuclease/phosphatase family metal-dependent hydrolase
MPRSRSLNVVTYNIHKGLSQFNRRIVLHEIRDRLRSLDADVAFLQEVQGKHAATSPGPTCRSTNSLPTRAATASTG